MSAKIKPVNSKQYPSAIIKFIDFLACRIFDSITKDPFSTYVLT